MPNGYRTKPAPFLDELRSPVSNLAIALHLAEAKAALPRSAFHGLPDEDLDRPPGPRVDLVVDHVLQTLVVRRSKEDLCVHLLARVAAVHHLVTCGVR